MAEENTTIPAPEAPVAPTAPATAINDIISEFRQPEPESSAPGIQAAPVTPEAPAAPPETVEEPDALADDWWEKLLAVQQDNTDPYATLLADDSLQSALAEPAKAQEYVTQLHGALKAAAESARSLGEFTQAIEYAGGRDNLAGVVQLAGDLLRGALPIEGEENVPAGLTYVDRFVEGVKQVPGNLYGQLVNSLLGDSTLRLNPEYLLERAGLDPRYVNDYLAVAKTGGYTPPVDAAAENEWLAANIPSELHDTYRRLSTAKREDMRLQAVEIAVDDLRDKQYIFDSRQQAESARQQAESVRAARVEWQATKSLGDYQTSVFNEYRQKGEGLGLSALESAGVAALAYVALQDAFWDDKSESRQVTDALYGRYRDGNQLQIQGGQGQYKKLFHGAWEQALRSNPPRRKPTAPANGAVKPAQAAIPAPTSRPPQFSPNQPPSDRVATTINEIMREFGVGTGQ